MTLYPIYKQLSDYPHIDLRFPVHVSVNRIEHRFPPHRHDFLECSFVLSGSGSEIVNGVPHALRPGTFTLLLPYQVHELRATAGTPLVLYNCMFDMQVLTGQMGYEAAVWELFGAEETLPPFSHYAEEELRWFEEKWAQLLHEYERSAVRWRSALISARLIELLARFDRSRRQGALPLEALERGAPGSSAIWRAVHDVHVRYREPLTLAELAHKFGLSASRLSESFREKTGLPFVAFLHELRVRHACTLLLTTDRSVTDIAYEVGFQSFQTFSRVFRRVKGTTPSVFRQKGAGADK